MYYKVIKNNKVIDVLDNLIYLKWDSKHKIMVLTGEDDAQAIMSSDCNTIWHVKGFYKVPVDEPKFEAVELEEIDEFEYKQLKMLNLSTPEAIIDSFLLNLLENNII